MRDCIAKCHIPGSNSVFHQMMLLLGVPGHEGLVLAEADWSLSLIDRMPKGKVKPVNHDLQANDRHSSP